MALKINQKEILENNTELYSESIYLGDIFWEREKL